MFADILITNGRVVPMTALDVAAQSVAIGAGRILAIGAEGEVAQFAGPQTEVIDADGGTILPGFIESHMHLFPGAFSLRFAQLCDVHGAEALERTLRDYADANPDEGLLIAQGVNYDILGDATLDRHLLDEIQPDRPLLLQSCDLHNAWANTAALTGAGLLDGRDVGEGAEVVMGADGQATGLLKEFAAFAPVMTLRSSGGREGLGLDGVEPAAPVSAEAQSEDLEALRQGLAHCAALGITTIINMDGNRYQMELLHEIDMAEGLPCRIEVPYHFTPGEPMEALDEAESLRADFASPMLWCNRIKLFMDGVLDAETAYRLSDYPGKPGFRSAPLHSPEDFACIATEADQRGFQIAVHAIGDGAVRIVLDGYETARRANGPRDSRHRLEHIEMIHPDDVTRLAELGVTASLQPVHPPGCAGFPLEPTLSLIGAAEWPRAYLWRSLAQAGAHVCFSSDWPVAPLDPLFGIETALTRVPWSPELPDERLSLAETLAAYTSGGAYAAHLEDRLGQLALGLAADVLVLAGDLETALGEGEAPPPVAVTICAGKVSFRS